MEIALRLFLGRFQLPGEAQKIDRILQAFADAYYDVNQRSYHSNDVVFILAFSAVLLNTDAHNPTTKHRFRMTKKDYIRNHRGIDNSQDLPTELLERIYDSFTTTPLRLIAPRHDHPKVGEVEVIFGPGRLGLDIETALDGHSCAVVNYDTSAPATAEWHVKSPSKIPDITGWIITSVNNDSTEGLDYALTLWLLKSSVRPVLVRFCESSIYFQRL